MTQYLYFATDIEADGPIPGDYSMLSIGSVAFTLEEDVLSTFTCNIHPLPNAKQHPRTMDWWASYPDRWEQLQHDRQAPRTFCANYLRWIDSFTNKRPIFVSDYVGFDLQFVRWYLVHFADRDPFWTSQLDLMSYASAITKRPQPEHHHRNVPGHWIEDTVHDHSVLNDAMAHARMCIAMFQENGHSCA